MNEIVVRNGDRLLVAMDQAPADVAARAAREMSEKLGIEVLVFTGARAFAVQRAGRPQPVYRADPYATLRNAPTDQAADPQAGE